MRAFACVCVFDFIHLLLRVIIKRVLTKRQLKE